MGHPAVTDPFATDERRALAELTADFTRREIVPHLDAWEQAGEVPRSLHRAAAQAGLLGLGYAEELGGSGGDAVDVVVMTEAMLGAGASGGLVSALFTHGIALPHVVDAARARQDAGDLEGADHLLDTWVRPVLAGESIAALAVTEPDGGSDVADLRTRGVADGDSWVVDGTKTYITSGTRADLVVTAARTGGPGAGGLSLLVVDSRSEGFSASPRLAKMGWHSSDTAELSFAGVRVPGADLLGAEQGFASLARHFAVERLNIAVMGYATAQRCLDLTLEWVRERETFGRPLASRQVVRHTLVEMHRRTDVARRYARDVAVRLAAGEQVTLEAVLAKQTGVEAAEYVADRAVQLHGGMGYMRGCEVERHYRDVRILGIGGGATEVMTDLAARLMGLVTSMAPAPDLVVADARVRLPGGRWATGVAVTGDRISAIGESADVVALAGARTRVVRAPGRLVLPGFQDSHVHAPFAGRNLRRVWLNDVLGREAYLDVIARYAEQHPDEPWILGGGWAMECFPGGLPRKEDLDAVVPDRPVFLFNKDVHGAWVNSRALEAGGITRDTTDPWDGRIERDADGEVTGCLHEGAAYTFETDVVPAPARAEWVDAVLEAQRHLHALGITGWQDAWVTPATLEAYRTLAADGRLTARVVGALWWERRRGLDQVPDLQAQRESARGAAEAAGSGVPGFLPTTVKIMTDGVLENYTGALLEPYCDGCGGHTDNHGISFVDRDELRAAVTELDALGFQVHMHAIGDRAVRNALDAVEAARAANGPGDRRHHIAHMQVVQPVDVPRFAALDVVANCQTYWAQPDPQMDELTVPFLGDDRAALQYPFEAIRAAGARLAMGSDWAVTTADPLAQLEVAITRAGRGTGAFLPDQRLAVDVAIDAFTAGSAYVNHDDDAGTIEVGRRADLAMLDHDVLVDGYATPESAPLADASVVLTVAAGRVVHERGLDS